MQQKKQQQRPELAVVAEKMKIAAVLLVVLVAAPIALAHDHAAERAARREQARQQVRAASLFGGSGSRAAPPASATTTTKQQQQPPVQQLPQLAKAGAPVVPGQCFSIAYTTLARGGLKYGKGVWGRLKARDGKDVLQVVPAASAVPEAPLSTLSLADPALSKSFVPQPGFKLAAVVSAGADFVSFHTTEEDGRTYALNHFEGPQPAAVYLSELRADPSTGRLTVVDTGAVNASEVGAFWYPCSGTIAPWGAQLSGEEYPTDCEQR